jgi:RHS repeat-associated protein
MVVTDRGDVVELLDANGNPFAAYRYDAWGNPIGEGNLGTGIWSQTTGLITDQALADAIATRQPLRYASYCFDSESGMYYLSSRHYDPATRQFLSKDLSRNDGEQSAYQYCGGNPVGRVDPTGFALSDIINRWLGRFTNLIWKAECWHKSPTQIAQMRNTLNESAARKRITAQPTWKKAVNFAATWLNPIGLVSKLVGAVNPSLGVGTDFLTGAGSKERYYGASSAVAQAMMDTPTVQANWRAYQENGLVDPPKPFAYDSWVALYDTVISPTIDASEEGRTFIPFADPAGQFGGYDGATIHNNGDGTSTVTIPNVAGAWSLFFHLVPNSPFPVGPFANIYQTAQWTWPNDYNPN